MGKLAFVFPGQGAQFAGMGKELYESSPAAKKVLDQLSSIKPNLLELCFSGTAEQLQDTRNTQPCIFAVSLASGAAQVEAGKQPEAVAGFSLGELSALTFAGVFPLEDGFNLVCKRAELMAETAANNPAGMVAVLKLEADMVQQLANRHGVYAVNFNCLGQTVVAGQTDALETFAKAVKAEGGRALPLKVSGGFHSPMMASAAEGFAEVLAETVPKSPNIPVYANITGELYPVDIRETLTQQIVSPVRWQQTVENMVADGVEEFIEMEPGNVLTGLIEKCRK